jgi:hypothetical protein
MREQLPEGSSPTSEPATEANRTEGAAKEGEELWAEIEREIRTALERGSAPSLKWLEVQVGPAGIVVSGAVVMPYEGALAELVAKRHAHGMHVYSRIQVGVGGRPASHLGGV